MANIFSRKLQFIATQAQWNTKNPVLGQGEIGVEAEYTSGKITKVYIKSGDGVSTWTELPYAQDPNISLVGRTNQYSDLDGIPTFSDFSGLHSDLDLDDGTNPHGTTKEDLGLGNVDNTSDNSKPISALQLAEFNKKANISEISQVGLSNDYNDLDNKPTTSNETIIHSAINLDDGTNPHGTNKSDVGLSLVDNTADLDKPVSIPQQNSLNTKLNISQVLNDFSINPDDTELAAGANTVYQILQDIEGLEIDKLENIVIVGDSTYTISETDSDAYLIFNNVTGTTVTLPNVLDTGFKFWAETKVSADVIFSAEGILQAKFGTTVSTQFEHLKFVKTGGSNWSGGLLTSQGLVGDTNTIEEITANVDVPGLGIKRGDSIPIGTSLTDSLKQLLISIFNPQLIDPSFSLSRSGSQLRVIGSSSTFNLTFNFNRGQILGDLISNLWEENEIQDFRAGPSISYTIDGINQSGNVLSRTLNVNQGDNTFLGFVDYAIGTQPLNSEGDNFNSPFPAGTSSSESTSFEGVYPLFGSTATITTSTQQSLVSMLSGNNIQLNLVAESGGNKQFIEIPNAWLTNRALQSIQFFNTVSNQFDTTNQLSTFTTSSTNKTIEGNSIGYTRYTNNTSNRGSITIRLIF